MMKRVNYLWLVALVGLLAACQMPLVVVHDDKSPKTPAPVIIKTQPDIVIVKPEQKNDAVYICTLSAFTSTYKAENAHQGKARLSVKKQCLNHFHEMFCQDEDIQCQRY